jgi:hypothetical protein
MKNIELNTSPSIFGAAFRNLQNVERFGLIVLIYITPKQFN